MLIPSINKSIAQGTPEDQRSTAQLTTTCSKRIVNIQREPIRWFDEQPPSPQEINSGLASLRPKYEI